jgi:hypothetical protein
MPSPVLLCKLPNGAPVWDCAPDKHTFADLGVCLARHLAHDEAIDGAPTALSLPPVQEEAPTAKAIGANEVGRRPSISITDFA